MNINWCFNQSKVNWDELADLYKRAPLGQRSSEALELLFGKSKFGCFVFAADTLIGVGRVLADGLDCAYIYDVAVDFKYQGLGLGKQIMQNLMKQSNKHKKIMLYSSEANEGFYRKLGFKKQHNAMVYKVISNN